MQGQVFAFSSNTIFLYGNTDSRFPFYGSSNNDQKVKPGCLTSTLKKLLQHGAQTGLLQSFWSVRLDQRIWLV